MSLQVEIVIIKTITLALLVHEKNSNFNIQFHIIYCSTGIAQLSKGYRPNAFTVL